MGTAKRALNADVKKVGLECSATHQSVTKTVKKITASALVQENVSAKEATVVRSVQSVKLYLAVSTEAARSPLSVFVMRGGQGHSVISRYVLKTAVKSLEPALNLENAGARLDFKERVVHSVFHTQVVSMGTVEFLMTATARKVGKALCVRAQK